MATIEIRYNGKTYTFTGDSVTLADRLVTQFGRIATRTASESGTEYATERGAVAFLSLN